MYQVIRSRFANLWGFYLLAPLPVCVTPRASLAAQELFVMTAFGSGLG